MSRIFLSAICSLWLLLLSTAVYPSVSLNFDHNHNTRLDGIWNYYPDQLINGAENSLIANSKTIQTVQLPASFSSISGHNDGIGTFQQRFHLPKSVVGQQIYLYIPYQYGAYQLFIDDHLRVKVGQVGREGQHHTEMGPKLVSFFPSKTDVVITIQASSFQHIRGGLENSIFIGFSKPILHKFYRQIIPLTIVSGILLMMGCFMVLFALYRIAQKQSNYIWLFLGLFILCLSLRSFFAVPFLYTLFTDISWVWGIRLEYFLTELACVFFLSYIYLLPYRLIHPCLFKLTTFIIILNIAVTLFTEPLIFQTFFFQSFSIAFPIFLNLIYAAYRMHKEKMNYSKVNSVAVIIVCLTFIHDYLLALKLIDSVEIAFYTSCLYFMLMTFQLSRDYAVQSMNTEVLNKKLLRWNKELDQKVQERTRDITLLNQQLARQVRLDSLTGAYNRFALNEEIQKQYKLAVEAQSSLAFYMIDVDYFKRYNDYYGHLKGDQILKEIVQNIAQILPPPAFLARYGGEEFVVLLPHVDHQQATFFADLLCDVIRQQQIEHCNRDDEKTYITISVGAAVMDEQHIYQNVHRIMKTADQQLYIAKEGRDRAVLK